VKKSTKYSVYVTWTISALITRAWRCSVKTANVDSIRNSSNEWGLFNHGAGRNTNSLVYWPPDLSMRRNGHCCGQKVQSVLCCLWPRGKTSSINSGQSGSEAPSLQVDSPLNRFASENWKRCPGRPCGWWVDNHSPAGLWHSSTRRVHSGAMLWSTLTTH